jgi:hypothetical protein
VIIVLINYSECWGVSGEQSSFPVEAYLGRWRVSGNKIDKIIADRALI